jgi:hypothetical protein
MNLNKYTTDLNKYGALSTLLVPLTLILYFVKNIKAPLTYGMITIGIVGIIDTILMCNASNICSFCPYSNLAYKPIVCMLSIIGHLVILYPLIEFKKYGYPNIPSYLFGFILLITVIIIPWWPYQLSRKEIIIIGGITYIFLTILFEFIKHKIDIKDNK